MATFTIYRPGSSRARSLRDYEDKLLRARQKPTGSTLPGVKAGAAIGLADPPVAPLTPSAPDSGAARRLHVVSLSGGFSSAVAAERVIERYGKENVMLWFADTKWEDDDLYTFLDWFEERTEMRIARWSDGRNPLQVAEDASNLIPNTNKAPCTDALKIAGFVATIKWLLAEGFEVTVYIGYNWTEPHRMAATRANYKRIGVQCEFPLIEWGKPDYRSNSQIAREWGIALPEAYKLGYSHRNCGRRCVKMGVGDWIRTLLHTPERFAEVETWEKRQRQIAGREDRAICREMINGVTQGITLQEIRERVEAGFVFTPNGWKEAPASASLLNHIEELDNIACVCDAGDIGPAPISPSYAASTFAMTRDAWTDAILSKPTPPRVDERVRGWLVDSLANLPKLLTAGDAAVRPVPDEWENIVDNVLHCAERFEALGEPEPIVRTGEPWRIAAQAVIENASTLGITPPRPTVTPLAFTPNPQKPSRRVDPVSRDLTWLEAFRAVHAPTQANPAAGITEALAQSNREHLSAVMRSLMESRTPDPVFHVEEAKAA